MRFWDSSAIVPLVIGQRESAQADAWFTEDSAVAVWTFTMVEVVSALRRLVREGTLAERVAREAEARAGQLALASHTVIDIEAVKSQAARLLRVHPLRAADALQLGAAVEWATGRTAHRALCTFDRRLALAAVREGFHVLPEPE